MNGFAWRQGHAQNVEQYRPRRHRNPGVEFRLRVLAVYAVLSKLPAGRYDLARPALLQAYAIGGLAS